MHGKAYFGRVANFLKQRDVDAFSRKKVVTCLKFLVGCTLDEDKLFTQLNV